MHPRQQLDLGSIEGTTEAEVLRSFVESVRQWRGSSKTAPRFRRDDLIVLAGLLGTDAEGIERRLIALTGCNRATAKRLRRLLLVALASMPIAPFAVAYAPLPEVAGAAAPFSLSVDAARFPPVAVAVDGTASSTTAVPPVDPPVVSDPAPVVPAAAPVVPVAAPVLVTPVVAAPDTVLAPGSEANLSIPSVGIELPVVGGGQDVIDQGQVAHYWAPGWHDPAAAGAVGTYWLAAHHETHGSPFLRLPDVVVGDQIVVTTASQTFTYTVTSLEVVEEDAGFGPVYGTDPDASVILLQTCLDHVRRLLVHGTLTTAA